jgi:predicted  nucleic acid-binding Zn-ribbon protein
LTQEQHQQLQRELCQARQDLTLSESEHQSFKQSEAASRESLQQECTQVKTLLKSVNSQLQHTKQDYSRLQAQHQDTQLQML